MTTVTYWYREVDSNWPDGLDREMAVFGDEKGIITMSLASFDTIMQSAGYERIRTVKG